MEITILFMKRAAWKLCQTSVFVSNKVAMFCRVYFALGCRDLLVVILIFCGSCTYGLCLIEEAEIDCQFNAYLNFFKAPVNDPLKYFPTHSALHKLAYNSDARGFISYSLNCVTNKAFHRSASLEIIFFNSNLTSYVNLLKCFAFFGRSINVKLPFMDGK